MELIPEEENGEGNEKNIRGRRRFLEDQSKYGVLRCVRDSAQVPDKRTDVYLVIDGSE